MIESQQMIKSQQWLERLENSLTNGDSITYTSVDRGDNRREPMRNIVDYSRHHLSELNIFFDEKKYLSQVKTLLGGQEDVNASIIALSARITDATNAMIDKRVEKREEQRGQWYNQMFLTMGKIISFFQEWTGIEIF